MRKILYIAILIFSLTSCSKSVDELLPPDAMLIYMAGYNNLSSDASNNIEAILNNIPEKAEKDIFIMVTNMSKYTIPTLYKVEKKGSAKGYLKTIATYENNDVANVQTLKKIVNDVNSSSYNRLKDVLFWSHSTSWLPNNTYENLLYERSYYAKGRSFGDDRRFDGSYINIDELKEALTGLNLNTIIFDSCLMGSVEVGYELRNCARYVIVAPTEIWQFGFPYSEVIDLFCTTTTKEVAMELVNRFDAFYKREYAEYGSTISLYDSSQAEQLANVVRDIISKYPSSNDYNLGGIIKYDRAKVGFAYDLKQYLYAKMGVTANSNTLDKSLVDEALRKYIVLYKGTDKFGENFYTQIDISGGCGASIYLMKPLSYLNLEIVNTYYKSLDWYKKIYGQ